MEEAAYLGTRQLRRLRSASGTKSVKTPLQHVTGPSELVITDTNVVDVFKRSTLPKVFSWRSG